MSRALCLCFSLCVGSRSFSFAFFSIPVSRPRLSTLFSWFWLPLRLLSCSTFFSLFVLGGFFFAREVLGFGWARHPVMRGAGMSVWMPEA